MNFYVISKCVPSEKGDIILDLDHRVIQFYRSLYWLEEDRCYQIKENHFSVTDPCVWTPLKTYQLAFNRKEEMNYNGFYFTYVGKKDKIRVDGNGFMYKNELFMGKITNEKEWNIFIKEGAEMFSEKLNQSAQKGIKLLVKGKKIYRIFTKSRLEILASKAHYGSNLLDLAQNQQFLSRAEEIREIEKNILLALDLLHQSLGRIEKLKKMEE